MSDTVNVLVHVLKLPAASVTVSVTVVTPVPTNVPAVGDCVITSEAAAVQLSVAVTPVVKFGTAAWQVLPALAIWFEPHDDIVGAVASLTVNVLVHVLELPAASVTVIVTVVTPVPTSVPAVGDCVITSEAAAVQLSVAVTPVVKFGTAAWQVLPALAV